MLNVNWEIVWNNIKNGAVKLFVNGGLLLLEFLAILIVGIIIIKIARSILRKLLGRTKLGGITQKFIVSTTVFVLDMVLVIILIQILGIPLTGFIAVFSAVGLAVGLALQSCLANFFNGVILISGKYFNEGDFVEFNGIKGKVEEIKLLYTRITTNDNRVITVPNSTILSSNVVNYSANNMRRVDFSFELALGCDVNKAKSIVLGVMKSEGKVYINGKEPFVAIDSITNEEIKFFAYCWCDTEDYWDVYYYVLETVFNEFKKQKIAFSKKQLTVLMEKKNDVVFDKTPLKKRVEKQRVEQDNEDIIVKAIKKVIKKKKEANDQAKIEKVEMPKSDAITETEQKIVKKRGRPAKNNIETKQEIMPQLKQKASIKTNPEKQLKAVEVNIEKPKRGRPKKN